ncbi:ommochrome-binding protein-like [Manduca sexta]|uniref:ommochrome-binding protein-like n=1 Tax=Manduca sexta TaxID=7130 RepID=UPI00188F4592|nr:ommochrome-binding protein-like [Manduca sexta]
MEKMLFKIFLLFATTSALELEPCHKVKIGDNWYEKQVLWSHFGRPYNLNVHKTSNTLFFSYSVPESYSDVDFQLAFYNMDSKEYQTIAGIKGGCTVAIDQATDDIFLGGSDGIYKYNMLTKLADYYKEKGKNVWSLFYRRNLFYISYPDQILHIEVDGRFAVVKEFERFEIDHFHITNDDVIYFANKTGLYKYDKKNLEVVVINELITVRQVMEDNDGELYVCTNFGVFVDVKFEGLKKIIDIKNIFGIAFDRDNNLIYSDERSIIKLLYSVQGCPVNNSQW